MFWNYIDIKKKMYMRSLNWHFTSTTSTSTCQFGLVLFTDQETGGDEHSFLWWKYRKGCMKRARFSVFWKSRDYGVEYKRDGRSAMWELLTAKDSYDDIFITHKSFHVNCSDWPKEFIFSLLIIRWQLNYIYNIMLCIRYSKQSFRKQ